MKKVDGQQIRGTAMHSKSLLARKNLLKRDTESDTPSQETSGAHREATIGSSNATTPLTLGVPVHDSSHEDCEEEHPGENLGYPRSLKARDTMWRNLMC